MKKYHGLFFSFAVLIMAAMFSLAGCDEGSDPGGNNNGGNSNGALSGTYTYDAGYTITFNSNGTFSGSYGGSPLSGTYTVTGATLTLNITGYGTQTWGIVNGTTIRDEDGDNWVKGNNGGGGNTTVTFNSVTANGSSSQTTTQLTLTFSQAITGLSASDITLSGVSGVNKGSLSGSGPSYTLGISGFTSGGTLNVAVSKSGYTISGSPKSTTIYYYSNSGGNNGGGTAPSAPTGVTATAQSSSSINVSWNTVSGATSYDVYYEIGNSSTKNFAGNTTNTSYLHSGLTASTTYYYYIKAKNSSGESAYSSSDSATTQSSSGGGNNNGGGNTIQYMLDDLTFGACSRNGNNITINWSLKTSGTNWNGAYTYTQPSSIIIQVYNGTSFDDLSPSLSGSAKTFTLNNYSAWQYSPAGVSGNRVTIRVLCKSTYGDKYSTTTYYVESNTFSPSYN